MRLPGVSDKLDMKVARLSALHTGHIPGRINIPVQMSNGAERAERLFDEFPSLLNKYAIIMDYC